VGAPAPLRADEKRRNLQGKFVSAQLRQSRSQFLGHYYVGGEDLESGSFISFSLCFEGDD